MPALIARYALDVRSRSRVSFCAAVGSLVGVSLTLALALAHEFEPAFPRVTFGMPTMVLTHGLLNALVVVPALYVAICTEP